MRRIVTGSGTWTALALHLVVTTASLARGETVPLHTVPRPVQDAVRARFMNARIAHVEKERAGGGFVYEIKLEERGKYIDVTLAPAGAILLIKREIGAEDLPEPAVQALAAAYPGATYQAVEAVFKGQGPPGRPAYYEVDLVTPQRRLVEVTVSVDGRILRRQQ